ncbi:hypothetical protein HMPREF9714_01291 [Myroides odoratimimus CCUG 12901]|uniref:Uncharacterized protein n=2 Tax=Myroides odoratimimus TaxID=76832 RepID=A0ABP2N8U5_9FLAO|nr:MULTISPECIES: hypothetical protein [Myroides]EHO07633.1 hypothetical protein HMPREF9712_02558 [Myroides odoratimimus CCUG 10230]EHO11770.1 hypothetical protein HMPREF9714_01291 [Myroides odoratimimus CCUG 12901]MDM1397260.1 hypothetical protein [Myroides odoratimimus]MDM1457633.1 hypothetical protein [Myroides odoratimimus]MDM1520446.1 hypothetical protein [Myroides odoratimimus]
MKSKIILLLLSVVLVTISCKKKIEEFPNTTTEEVVLAEEEWDDEGELSEWDDSADFTDKRWKDVDVHYTYHFTGKIDDKYAFDMYLKVFEDEISGYYYYLNNGTFIDINGTVSHGILEFKEEFGNTFRGHFDYDKGEVVGEWTNVSNGAVMPFVMANPKGKGYPQKQYKAFLNKTDYSNDTYNVTEIAEISDKHEVKRIEIESVFWYYKDEPNFKIYLQDYNFDGYLDISAFHFLPAYPPVKFQFLLYNSNSKEYVFDEVYNDSIYTSVPGTDFRKKLLYEYGEGRGGTEKVYKLHENKLYAVFGTYIGTREIDDSFNPPTWYYKIKNGKEIEITEEEFNQVYGKNVLKFFESKYCYEL